MKASHPAHTPQRSCEPDLRARAAHGRCPFPSRGGVFPAFAAHAQSIFRAMPKRERDSSSSAPELCDPLDVSTAELMGWIGSSENSPWAELREDSGSRNFEYRDLEDEPTNELSFIAGLFGADGRGGDASANDLALPVLGDSSPASAASGPSAYVPNCAFAKGEGSSPSGDDLEALLSTMPQSYAISTANADQRLHAKLLRQLRLSNHMPLTSWVQSSRPDDPLVRLHLVFKDRCAATCMPVHRPPDHPGGAMGLHMGDAACMHTGAGTGTGAALASTPALLSSAAAAAMLGASLARAALRACAPNDLPKISPSAGSHACRSRADRKHTHAQRPA